MPRIPGTALENTFLKGLITEATGLNFPENAVTSQDNVVFEKTGLVRRRLGIDIEDNGEIKDLSDYSIDDVTGVVNTYLWRTANSGSTVLLVVQIGHKLIFFDCSNAALSGQLKGFSVDLNAYTGQDSLVPTTECSFATGGGYLFICHPNVPPLVVTYKNSTSISTSIILLRIRDLEGYGLANDTNAVAFRPSTLTKWHHYNLLNQGWGFQGTAAA